MEKRGIRTERGDLNREIEVTNQRLRQLKARISKLQNWLKEEQENTEPPTLADYIQGILTRKAQAGKSGYSQSLYNLKDAAKMLTFPQANIYFKYKGKKQLAEAGQILLTAAKDYLKGVINGKSTISTKAWKAESEYAKLTIERKTLNQRILRREQREQQPHRKQDMER